MLPSSGLLWESFGKNQLGPEVRAPAAKDRQDEKINRVTKSGKLSAVYGKCSSVAGGLFTQFAARFIAWGCNEDGKCETWA